MNFSSQLSGVAYSWIEKEHYICLRKFFISELKL